MVMTLKLVYWLSGLYLLFHIPRSQECKFLDNLLLLLFLLFLFISIFGCFVSLDAYLVIDFTKMNVKENYSCV